MRRRPRISPWRHWVSRALDLLYPPRCSICEVSLRGGRSLCDACDRDLPRLQPPFCQSCGEMFPGEIDGDFACPNCRHLKFSFDFARAALCRDERALGMIHGLKYGRQIELAKELGRLAAEAFTDSRLEPALAGGWPLLPVPLHRQRLQQRYFNQAEEIARVLAHQTGLPLLRGLRRIRATEHQTALTRAQRLENLRGAFVISAAGQQHLIRNGAAGVILIDDVFTTGSTVDECAKILRRAGFQNVVVITVMRG
jgi:competence protein ComFC